MADGKLTYDIDFNVNTEAISRAIARAVDQATSARAGFIDTAVAGLGARIGSDYIYQNVRDEFAAVTPGGETIADFAAMAASSPYRYKPSTIQSLIRNEAAKAAAQYEENIDLQYKMDAEAATGDIRRNQRKLRAAELAQVYLDQGNLLAAAAAQASTPEAQRILLSRASGRFGSIASRTLMEAGGVDMDAASAALATSADLAAIRSGIKTTAQMQHAAESATSTWLRNEVKAGNRAVKMWADANSAREAEIEGSWAWAARQYKSENEAAATKAAQEDAAWAAREKELTYSPSQKAREMEAGFKAIEASSATEEIYSYAKDPFAQQYSVGGAITSAERYIEKAKEHAAGSSERNAYLNLASSSIAGLTPSSMSKMGMGSSQIEQNTLALEKLTAIIKELSGEGGGGGGGFFDGRYLSPAAIAGYITGGVKIATSVMEGRTQWLADTESPYQTRRDVRQGWAQKYGMVATGGGALLGAKAGAALGTAVAPGLGTAVGGVIGGVVGAIPGAVATVVGTHYKDEKKIGDSYQNRAVDMLRYYNLYGSGVDYNYAQMAEGTGYISRGDLLQMNQAADMFAGALSFGAVGEQQMMALSLAPNYYRALMNGASTQEMAEAYAADMAALPRQYRQYITSLLPGASESLRAFTSSNAFGYVNYAARELKYFDASEYAYAGGLERAKIGIAYNNVRDVYKNTMTEVPKLDAPNYYRTDAELLNSIGWGGMSYAPSSDLERRRDVAQEVAELWGGKDAKLGDIIIQIDGDTVHSQEYGVQDFIRGNQSYVVGV